MSKFSGERMKVSGGVIAEVFSQEREPGKPPKIISHLGTILIMFPVDEVIKKLIALKEKEKVGTDLQLISKILERISNIIAKVEEDTVQEWWKEYAALLALLKEFFRLEKGNPEEEKKLNELLDKLISVLRNGERSFNINLKIKKTLEQINAALTIDALTVRDNLTPAKEYLNVIIKLLKVIIEVRNNPDKDTNNSHLKSSFYEKISQQVLVMITLLPSPLFKKLNLSLLLSWLDKKIKVGQASKILAKELSFCEQLYYESGVLLSVLSFGRVFNPDEIFSPSMSISQSMVKILGYMQLKSKAQKLAELELKEKTIKLDPGGSIPLALMDRDVNLERISGLVGGMIPLAMDKLVVQSLKKMSSVCPDINDRIKKTVVNITDSLNDSSLSANDKSALQRKIITEMTADIPEDIIYWEFKINIFQYLYKLNGSYHTKTPIIGSISNLFLAFLEEKTITTISPLINAKTLGSLMLGIKEQRVRSIVKYPTKEKEIKVGPMNKLIIPNIGMSRQCLLMDTALLLISGYQSRLEGCIKITTSVNRPGLLKRLAMIKKVKYLLINEIKESNAFPADWVKGILA